MVHSHLLTKHLNKVIEIETGRGSIYKGKMTDIDDWCVHFIPRDRKLKPAIILLDDIRKVILVYESKRSA